MHLHTFVYTLAYTHLLHTLTVGRVVETRRPSTASISRSASSSDSSGVSRHDGCVHPWMTWLKSM